jgi:hypothetical protein
MIMSRIHGLRFNPYTLLVLLIVFVFGVLWTLVNRETISPAIVSLLLENAQDVLKYYSRLQKPKEFPSINGLDFPFQMDSEIYLKDGPSFLHRHLPF